MLRSLSLFLTLPALAQLIPTGAALPKGSKPPVVFVNGYQTYCGNSQFSDSFGKFDQFLQATGRVTVFFDNCSVPGKPAIESVGVGFGAFISALKYTDGTAVPSVDVVAHSMGGLIVRAYLAGLQADGTFAPPADTRIRKTIFLSTPHFGTDVAAVFGIDTQTKELATASPFVFTLGTWNQGTDDLRGVDALAVAGNLGVGTLNGAATGDGVSSLTSSSIGFALPLRTRVIPYCHISFAALSAIAGSFLATQVCPVNAPGIAVAAAATDANAAIVLSFLNDTADWQTIGTAAEQNPLLSTQAGIILRAQSAMGDYVTIQDAAAGKTNLKPTSPAPIDYNEFVPAGQQDILADTSSGRIVQNTALPAGYTSAITVKTGPRIARVFPAAAAVAPLSVAPGSFISIYGTNLAPAVTQATTTPLPTMLGGTQVLIDGTAIPLQIVTPNQINAILPLTVSGVVKVAVNSPTGQHAVNLLIAASVPALFTQNGAGTGLASVLNAVTSLPVSPTAPLHAGDFAAIYLTGLGNKTAAGVAAIAPTVTIGGQACPVQYAGVAPGFAGLDQINCQLPAGIAASASASLIVSANGRASNAATLVIQ